ncbi:MAG: hypothetical protein JWQ22_316 [Devosia sp.]|nr:hypothetical protein [Devosia sp.]
MPTDDPYAKLVDARRALRIPGYATFADVGLDGPWTTPYQIASRSADGPVLLTYNYLDAPSARKHRSQLLADGFLPRMPFNMVLNIALARTGMKRSDLYVTHAFHLLPATRSAAIQSGDVDISFDAIARHELSGRKVIALGAVAARVCARHGIAHLATTHPSARGLSFAGRAEALASALGG